jgi:GNAT superfamily N-acetyltransferase
MTTDATQTPLRDVVSVHLDAFPGFFMSQLGPAFLTQYYRCVAEYPLGVLLTESDERGCIGFVSGFVNPAHFYAELRRRRLRFASAACLGIARRPSRLLTVFANYRRAGGAAHRPPEPDTAELSSLAVRPSAARRGVGARLVRRFETAAANLGAARVILTTDTHGNDAVNRFYQQLGFACVRTFEARRDRLLNEYQFEIRKDP